MTREEAIAILEESNRQNEIMRDSPSTFWAEHQMADGVKNTKRRIEALDAALTALRPVSLERVEKVWKYCEKCKCCPNCIYCPSAEDWPCQACDKHQYFEPRNFCSFCGKPLTDEAVQMVMEKLEAMKDGEG